MPVANEIYDSVGARYAAAVDAKPHNADYERPAMRALIGDVAGKAVLDLGTGSGYFAAWALEQGASRVVAVDASTTMAEIAARRTAGRAEIHVAALEDPLNALADASVDVAIASLVLHYVSEWEPVVRDVFRMLRPGGAFVLSVGSPVADWPASVTKRYHDTELLLERWNSLGVTMPVYRRPLGAMFAAFASAPFMVARVVEPRPVASLATRDPAAFAELDAAPAFLCVRLEKPGASSRPTRLARM